jgi:hypothetical protein
LLSIIMFSTVVSSCLFGIVIRNSYWFAPLDSEPNPSKLLGLNLENTAVYYTLATWRSTSLFGLFWSV